VLWINFQSSVRPKYVDCFCVGMGRISYINQLEACHAEGQRPAQLGFDKSCDLSSVQIKRQQTPVYFPSVIHYQSEACHAERQRKTCAPSSWSSDLRSMQIKRQQSPVHHQPWQSQSCPSFSLTSRVTLI